MTPAPKNFSVNTLVILEWLPFTPFPAFAEIPPETYEQFTGGLVLDLDGVVRDHKRVELTEDEYSVLEIAQKHSEGPVILSTMGVPPPEIPEGIRVYTWRDYGPKLFPRVLNRQMTDAGITREDAFALGDGLTDMFAYWMAGIGNIGLVEANATKQPDPVRKRPHPAQKAVRSNVYTPGALLVATAIGTAQAIKGRFSSN